MPEIKLDIETLAKIKVIGVGGSGGSAVNRMIQSKIKGVDFVALNTDVQALHYSNAAKRLHIGKNITKGLGAGMDPELGRKAAEESQNELKELLKGADMVFITCGLGGGTGSGASPLVAEIARELGVLTVAVVTKPFTFEGAQRKLIADKAHNELAERVDTIITIYNDRVLQIIDKKTSLIEAFDKVDDILHQGVQGISELITTPGLINVDFADIRAVMKNQGSALMGVGVASGEDRAISAARDAISSPLLDVSIEGARGILFTITGGNNLGMHEVSEAAKLITSSADPNAKIIFGAVIDKDLKDEVRVTVVATGFDDRPSGALGAVTRAQSLGVSASNGFLHGKDVDDSKDLRRSKEVNSVQPRGIRQIFGNKADRLNDSGEALKGSATLRAKAEDEVEEISADDLEIPAFLRKKL